MRRNSSFSACPKLARLPLRPRIFPETCDSSPGSPVSSSKHAGRVIGGFMSPKSTKSATSTRFRDVGFFSDGTQSETVMMRKNSVCSTAAGDLSPKQSAPALERKLSKSSIDTREPKEKDPEPKTPKSAALLLARCMQSRLHQSPNASDSPTASRPTTPEAAQASQLGRPLQAASGLVLKGKRRDTSAHEERQLLLPNEFKSRLLQRQGTSPAILTLDDDSPMHARRPRWDFGPARDFRQLEEKEKIFDLYQWSQVLQEEGDGGKVVVCQPKAKTEDVRTYVMKMRSKKSLRDNMMEQHFRKSLFALLNMPEHVGVLPLEEVLEDQQFYYIVMEQAAGGSFFDGLLKEFKDGIMPPREVQRLMRGILEAIGHVHDQGLIHRDIKPDNLVMRLCDDDMSPSGKSRQVALIDFDHADPEFLHSKGRPSRCCEYFCGTVSFSAPEAFLGYFSPASDLYSIGIILYLLMSGKMPYDNSIYQEEMGVAPQPANSRAWTTSLHKRLKHTPIDWRCDPWPQQPQCCSFCQWLLAFEPGKRPSSAEEALQHEWFADDA
eukprot:CAMPEP_0181449582 /NCGR_PEP_ID=MMETSP1110-20121109/27733_1 /TAXON_ID=174948 /ORGANISM="Symbiodinium sp., Strain CCMP421" /LENGTH=549 /DNA_ID=CAMNT_0023573773 /DNA_START=39 /DNA_END=1688 /DNA_ORIENTATION=+